MKKLVLVLLIVLALLAWGGLVSAQGGGLRAVVPGAATLYAEPSAEAEVVAELPASTEFTVTMTSEDGAWLTVVADDGSEGYVMADAAVVLSPAALAPLAYVAPSSAGATGLFTAPQIGADIVAQLPDGTVGMVLGTDGEFAYVATALGKGWSVASAWEFLPDGSGPQLVTLNAQPEAGIFAEPNINADLLTTVPNGSLVFSAGAAEGEFQPVLAPDGSMGYMVLPALSPVPTTMVDTVGGAQSTAALFDAADFNSNIIAPIDNGTMIFLVSAVDDFWYEAYVPALGSGFVLGQKLGAPYTVATVQVDNAVVRAGPNDNVYNAIATVPAGTRVVAQGVSASGAWIQVAIPFSEVDFGYYGVSGWMRDYLFVDADGNSDLDTTFLAVTE